MQMNMANAINSALDNILSENPNAVMLGEDIGKDGGVFRVTEGLFDKYGDGRVMDTPLAESGIIGVSIGMALAGMLPIPEVQFAGFMYLGFDQLISHAARYRSRTRSTFSVPMIVRTPVSGGVRSLEHHSESPEAYYSHSGGLIVVEPSSPYDAKGLLIRASHLHDTVIFLEPTKLYRLFRQEVPENSYEVEIGKANKVRDGDDLSIITYGTMVNTVKNVVEKREPICRHHRPAHHKPDRRRGNNKKREEDGQGAYSARGAEEFRRRRGDFGQDSRKGHIRARCSGDARGLAQRTVSLSRL